MLSVMIGVIVVAAAIVIILLAIKVLRMDISSIELKFKLVRIFEIALKVLAPENVQNDNQAEDPV